MKIQYQKYQTNELVQRGILSSRNAEECTKFRGSRALVGPVSPWVPWVRGFVGLKFSRGSVGVSFSRGSVGLEFSRGSVSLKLSRGFVGLVCFPVGPEYFPVGIKISRGSVCPWV